MRKTGQRFNSTELKKGVTVIKCFICNQIFYAQNVFDSHMKNHSNKLSRNAPQEMQRKTLESFRVKKGVQGRGSSAAIKESMNKTTKLPVSNKMKENKIENNQPDQLNISTEESALRQSTLLIQKIQILTRQEPQKTNQQQQQTFITASETTKKPVQVINQTELAKLVLGGKRIPIEIIQNCVFYNQILKNYQQQLQYLSELGDFETEVSNKKIEQMKQKIVKSICGEIKQVYGKKQETRQKQRESQNEGHLMENIGVSYCGECYSGIEYGDNCWEMECGHKYHEQCWEEGKKCCK